MVSPSASSRNLVSSTHEAPLTHLTSTCTSPSGPMVISSSFFSAMFLLPLRNGEFHGAVLLHRVGIDGIALFLDGGHHALVGILGIELLDDFFFLHAAAGLDAPPVGLERIGAVLLLYHPDVV